MKYLLFNAAVVAALAYIFIGDSDVSMKDVTNPVAKALDSFSPEKPAQEKANIRIEPIVVKSSKEELSEQEKFILYGEKPASRQNAPKEIPVDVKPIEQTRSATPPMPTLPDAVDVPARSAKPPVTQSGPVQTAALDTTIAKADKEPVITLVDEAERRKNLRRLVADMERLFAEKLSR